MLPSEVNGVKVSQGTEFNKQGDAMSYRLYSFYIGNHGPFQEKFYAGEQDTAAIERRISNDVAQLREQGLLPQK